MSAERMVWFDDQRLRMVLEFYRGRVFVHLKVRQWGPSVYRLMRARWPELVVILRRLGHAKIHAFYRASNRSMAAFAGRFGFVEVRRTRDFVLLERSDA